MGQGRNRVRKGNKSAHKAEAGRSRRRAASEGEEANSKNGIEINGQVMAKGQKGNDGKK